MKHFTIVELCRSNTADRFAIDNRCKKKHVFYLTQLVENELDPLGEAYGKPIIVNSGFRSEALNRKIGGSATSDHMKGMAADITGGNPKENRRLFYLIQELGLPFDQLIEEKNFSWIHVSYRGATNRNQILKL